MSAAGTSGGGPSGGGAPRPRREVPATTLERQRHAAAPDGSAWVSANAGSGKTHVLVERVVALLVAGTDPGRILCLTFTRAAAAEMASRVFARLAGFTTMDDAALDVTLAAFGGAGGGVRRAEARRLFARALETPGGLKIQTIHAFCASLLGRFPLEANVAGRFAVLDEQLAAELEADALAAVLARAAADPAGPFAGAVAALQPIAADDGIGAAIGAVVRRREALRRFVRDHDGLAPGLAALRGALGLGLDDTAGSLTAEVVSGRVLAGADLDRLAGGLGMGSTNAVKRAEDIAAAAAGDVAARAEAWRRFLFDAKGNPRDFDKAMTKAVAAAHADLAPLYRAEQDRVAALDGRIAAAAAHAATAALLTLADAVVDRVEAAKRRRGLVDHGDLIARAGDLLSRADAAAWVRFKLDQGIDHILVDEAQDTSREQWRIVRLIAEEFFAGEGSHGVRRTVFAVGDEKQSIYGFQGAAPELFHEMRRRFAAAAGVVGEAFRAIELTLSFRSTPEVLAAVDRVFANPAAHAGLAHEARGTVHEAIRRGEAGAVELWPLEEPLDVEEPDDWRAALDHVGRGDPRERLAERIARTVAGWIAAGERRPDGTPIGPGDVIVLLRKRGPIVEALSRALKRVGVPVAGADRLTLSEHIAVEDLVALGRALVTPADDLTLAAVLKGPLFDVDEDHLFRLAHGRPGTLAEALAAAAAAGDAVAFDCAARLDGWRRLGRDVRPFELYAAVLGRDGGRRRFLGRFGGEVEEVIDAFLDQALAFEQVEVPTLPGFLAWFAAAPVEIKRETDTRPSEVRLMTVHGAKGLEAPVVFLVDDGGPASRPTHDPTLFEIPIGPAAAERPPGLLWVPRGMARPAPCERLVDEARTKAAAEHRRLLYVALTRAADRLIVCGTAPKRGAAGESWFSLVADALVPEAEAVVADGRTVAWRWRPDLAAGEAMAAAPAEDALPGGTADALRPAEASSPAAAARPTGLAVRSGPADGAAGAETPRWIGTPLAEQDRATVALSPSAAVASRPFAEAEGTSMALQRGRLVHRLVELLAGRPADERPALAARFLAAEAPDLAAADAAALAGEAVAVLADPALAPLFGPEGRAEVPLAGTLSAADGRAVAVAGRIDRLVVAADAVTIVDLKTERAVPPDAAAADPAHVAQLALYRGLAAHVFPGLTVRAALLYTAGPRLVEIDADRLDAALAATLAGAGAAPVAP